MNSNLVSNPFLLDRFSLKRCLEVMSNFPLAGDDDKKLGENVARGGGPSVKISI